MIIVILNHVDMRVELLDVPQEFLTSGVEKFLSEHGYSLPLYSWISAPSESIPVLFRDFSTNRKTGKEEISCRESSLRNECVYDAAESLAAREREELAAALRHKGKPKDGCYTFRIRSHRPVITAIVDGRAADVVVTEVEMEENGRITLLAYDKEDYAEEETAIPAEDFYCGQLHYVTNCVCSGMRPR